MHSALLYGATGLVGGHCLRLLLADACFARVTAVTRRPTSVEHEKFGERVVDFRDPAALRSLREGEDVFCCLGTTIKEAGSEEAFRAVDYGIPLAVAKAAVESKARTFLLVSSMGADPKSRFLYPRVKGELEEAVKALSIPTVHIFRPALLLGERAETRPAERVSGAILRVLSPLLLPKYRPISAEAVARAMIRAACSEVPGRFVHESDEIWRLGV